MSVVSVDRSTGSLLVEGRKVFPLVLSDGPPLGAKAPSGNDAFAEVDLGSRVHRNRPLSQLAPQAEEIVRMLLQRR